MQRVLVLLIVAASAMPAWAAVINGSFENGLTDWEPIVHVDAAAPITTADVHPVTEYLLSGHGPLVATDGGNFALLEAHAESLVAPNDQADQADAALRQLVVVNQFDVLSGDYFVALAKHSAARGHMVITASRPEGGGSHIYVPAFIGGGMSGFVATWTRFQLSFPEGGEYEITFTVEAALTGEALVSAADAVAGIDNLSISPPLPGDTNFDGKVDLADLNNIRNNFAGMGIGDTAPFDGDVDLDDLNAVRNNFGAGGANPVPVPEPSSLALLVLGAAGIVARRQMVLR